MNTDIDSVFSTPKATEKQIRSYFASQGCEVRISEGHIRFRRANRSPRDTAAWMDGRWVEEYHVVDGEVVHI